MKFTREVLLCNIRVSSTSKVECASGACVQVLNAWCIMCIFTFCIF